MALELSTLHVFAYGETQLIAKNGEEKNINKKVKSSQLSNLQALIDDLLSKKPEDVPAFTEVGQVNIFKNLFADVRPKEGKGFRLKWELIDESKLNSLVNEISSISVE